MLGHYAKNVLLTFQRYPANFAGRMPSLIRLYKTWRHYRLRGKNSLADYVPWITFEARFLLEGVLTPNTTVFEWGSGSSTMFYALRCREVVSVEHNRKWYEAVMASLQAREIANCECVLRPPQRADGLSTNPDDPESYASASEEFTGFSFRDYVHTINHFPNQYFDLVAIDGRARPSCLLHARSKVKRNGYLLLDNSERPHYERAKSLLAGWQEWKFYGPGPYNSDFWETTIWKRRRGTSASISLNESGGLPSP